METNNMNNKTEVPETNSTSEPNPTPEEPYSTPKPNPTDSESNDLPTVRKMIEGLETGNKQVFLEHQTEDVVWEVDGELVPISPTEFQTIDIIPFAGDWIRTQAMFPETVSDFFDVTQESLEISDLEILDLFQDDDLVVARVNMEATVEETDLPFEVDLNFIIELEDSNQKQDQIKSVELTYNTFGVAEAFAGQNRSPEAEDLIARDPFMGEKLSINPDADSEETLQVVQEAYDGLTQFNPAGIQKFSQAFAEDSVVAYAGDPSVLPIAGIAEGKEATLELFFSSTEVFQDSTLNPRDILVNGDRAVVILDLNTFAATTNIPVDSTAVHYITVEDGLITNFQLSSDTYSLTSALAGELFFLENQLPESNPPPEETTVLLVGNSSTSEILRFDTSTGEFIDTFVSDGNLAFPTYFIFGPDEDLYVSSRDTDSVVRFDGDTGELIDVFASGEALDIPNGLAFGPDGNLYVSSTFTEEVLRFDGDTGEFIDVFASGGGLDDPSGINFGPDGNLYVSSGKFLNQEEIGTEILRYDGSTGEFIDAFVSGGRLNTPGGLVFGPDDNLYVSSNGTDEVLRYDSSTGELIDVFASGNGLDGPTILTFGPDDNLYVSSSFTDEVLRFDADGDFIDVVASGNGISLPLGVAVTTTEISENPTPDRDPASPTPPTDPPPYQVPGANPTPETRLVFAGLESNELDAAVPNSNFNGNQDIVFGGAGDDLVDASPSSTGFNRISGGTGLDELLASHRDRISGGEGEDILDASVGSGGNRLDGGNGNDELFAGVGDRLFAGAGDDILDATTGSGDNRLYGQEGNDTFFAGSGDRLLGGDGDDAFFVTDGGDNLITGGAGADAFWIGTGEFITTTNTITDFELDEDVIGVAGLGANSIDDLEFSQVNNDAIISFSGFDLATLLNTQVSDLQSSDVFVFA